MRRSVRALTLSSLALLLAVAVRADEGMWTFDNLPIQKMKAKYGFAPDQAWLDHVRQSAVRFSNGGSGSFISADGLVLTNHHVGHDFIQAVGDKDHDYVKNGFLAGERNQELPTSGLVLHALVSMENVTAKVDAAVKPGLDDKAAAKARHEALGALVAEEKKASGLTCEPVVLYQGGELWIYRYKTFTDVRLVAAPEYDVAAFGKDWDNFSFPRHDLDFSLFRVYEDGKPYQPKHFLKFSEKGAAYGDMTFVVGHPGRTSRLETLAQMEAKRDALNPQRIRSMERRMKAMRAFAAESPENERQVSAQLMGLGNGLKVMNGETDGLKDGEAMNAVADREKELKARVAKNPKLQALAGQSWRKIAEAMEHQKAIAKETATVNARHSELLALALEVVRLTEEAAKPEAQRQKDFKAEKIKARVQDSAPPAKDKETRLLADGFTELLEELGPRHPFVKAALGGKSAAEAAKALVEGTRIADPAFRTQLLAGGSKAVRASQDPAIALARVLAPLMQKLKAQQDGIAAVVAEHGARIAKARFAVYGKETYPDATFTLRLSYGRIETFPSAGTLAQPWTTFGGLYDRAAGWGPKAEEASWVLPPRWIERRTKLNPDTPYNFLSTNDIIGGNSGSPVVNKAGELIGLAFDGNIESLPGRFYYDGRVNRCLNVDSRALLEALDKVMDAGHLVREITAR